MKTLKRSFILSKVRGKQVKGGGGKKRKDIDLISMDSLFAKAEAVKPSTKNRKFNHNTRKNDSSTSEITAQSVKKHTSVPASLLPTSIEPSSDNVQKYSHIANKKLRGELHRQTAHNMRAKALVDESAEMLLVDEAGRMEVDGELERTWQVGQDEIVRAVGQEAAKGRKELKLDGGPYRTRYTRNGRCVTNHSGSGECCVKLILWTPGIWRL